MPRKHVHRDFLTFVPKSSENFSHFLPWLRWTRHQGRGVRTKHLVAALPIIIFHRHSNRAKGTVQPQGHEQGERHVHKRNVKYVELQATRAAKEPVEKAADIATQSQHRQQVTSLCNSPPAITSRWQTACGSSMVDPCSSCHHSRVR